jgi:hypothetical protein
VVLHLPGNFVCPRAGAVALGEHGPATRAIAALDGALWLRTDGVPHGSRQRREVVGAGTVQNGGPGATLLNERRLAEFGELGGDTRLRHARDLDELANGNFGVVEKSQQTDSCRVCEKAEKIDSGVSFTHILIFKYQDMSANSTFFAEYCEKFQIAHCARL